jgi:hypothetical protein|tara:strand:- start:2 stop:154 length:153 start_codon:yes stop_codon:yes gene_type:complete
MYKTNQQCWNEVTEAVAESKKIGKITMSLYGQENFIGLTQEQRNKVWSKL